MIYKNMKRLLLCTTLFASTTYAYSVAEWHRYKTENAPDMYNTASGLSPGAESTWMNVGNIAIAEGHTWDTMNENTRTHISKLAEAFPQVYGILVPGHPNYGQTPQGTFTPVGERQLFHPNLEYASHTGSVWNPGTAPPAPERTSAATCHKGQACFGGSVRVDSSLDNTPHTQHSLASALNQSATQSERTPASAENAPVDIAGNKGVRLSNWSDYIASDDYPGPDPNRTHYTEEDAIKYLNEVWGIENPSNFQVRNALRRYAPLTEPPPGAQFDSRGMPIPPEHRTYYADIDAKNWAGEPIFGPDSDIRKLIEDENFTLEHYSADHPIRYQLAALLGEEVIRGENAPYAQLETNAENWVQSTNLKFASMVFSLANQSKNACEPLSGEGPGSYTHLIEGAYKLKETEIAKASMLQQSLQNIDEQMRQLRNAHHATSQVKGLEYQIEQYKLYINRLEGKIQSRNSLLESISDAQNSRITEYNQFIDQVESCENNLSVALSIAQEGCERVQLFEVCEDGNCRIVEEPDPVPGSCEAYSGIQQLFPIVDEYASHQEQIMPSEGLKESYEDIVERYLLGMSSIPEGDWSSPVNACAPVLEETYKETGVSCQFAQSSDEDTQEEINFSTDDISESEQGFALASLDSVDQVLTFRDLAQKFSQSYDELIGQSYHREEIMQELIEVTESLNATDKQTIKTLKYEKGKVHGNYIQLVNISP